MWAGNFNTAAHTRKLVTHKCRDTWWGCWKTITYVDSPWCWWLLVLTEILLRWDKILSVLRSGKNTKMNIFWSATTISFDYGCRFKTTNHMICNGALKTNFFCRSPISYWDARPFPCTCCRCGQSWFWSCLGLATWQRREDRRRQMDADLPWAKHTDGVFRVPFLKETLNAETYISALIALPEPVWMQIFKKKKLPLQIHNGARPKNKVHPLSQRIAELNWWHQLQSLFFSSF